MQSNLQRAYRVNILMLLAGAAIGLACAYYVGQFPFDFSEEIKKARELGIVSTTILDGYPKTLDIITYISALMLPVLCSIAAWRLFVSSGNRIAFKEFILSAGEVKGVSRRRWIILVAFSLAWLAVSFVDIDFSFTYYNPDVRDWIFLGEEGQILSWANSIMHGQVYGKDFFCLYGPLLIYPVAWVMQLFGKTVMVLHVYSYILNVIAFGIILYSLHRTINNIWLLMVASTSAMLLYAHPVLLAPHTSYLRVALGVLPVMLLYRHGADATALPFVATGAVAGLSILFSHEVGICSAAALVIFVIMKCVFVRDWRVLKTAGMPVLAGVFIPISAALAFFAYKGALYEFIGNLYFYPKLMTLGFAAFPFPTLKDLFTITFDDNVIFPYWIIFIYVIASIRLIVRVVSIKATDRDAMTVALLVFGGLLFRVALARVSYDRSFYVFLPAFLLFFMTMDDIVAMISIRPNNPQRWAAATLGCIMTVTLCAGIYYTPRFKGDVLNTILRLRANISTPYTMPHDYTSLSIRGGGVHINSELAYKIRWIQDFLQKNTSRDEPVYFYPLEAGYYFLFDRVSPCAFCMSYLAITHDQQRELVSDLMRKAPRYIFYSTNSWRIDEIPEKIQTPIVYDYIMKNYSKVDSVLDIDVYILNTAKR